MDPALTHYFAPRLDGNRITLEDRFCRPGASFGPANVERAMGVSRVFHEHAERIRGGYRCPICMMTTTD